MATIERVKRKQLIRSAEGYLDLIMVFDDRWSLDMNLRQRMVERAIACLEQIKKPMGHKPYILFLKGQAHRAINEYSKAINFLQQSSRLDPDNIHTFLALAWCYKRVNRIDLAIEAMETAIQIESGCAIACYNLACYWALAGNVTNAVANLEKAFDLNPDYRDYVQNEPDFDKIRTDPEFQAATTVIV